MQEAGKEPFGGGNPAEAEEFNGDPQRFLATYLPSDVVFLQDHIPEPDVNIDIPPAEMESDPVQPVDPVDVPDASSNVEAIVPENLENKI
ncbi:unnamed protein product, partial [Mesorhabditis belari]|uniref:Uncharacterized protein n=1 Tax=Mesorhabditis belari TaxID=2138241 RepID=A0AAF3ES94_9BILA